MPSPGLSGVLESSVSCSVMARDSSCKSIDIAIAVDEKPEELDVEALGRKRPDVFTSAWMEVAFVGCMLVSLSMAVRIDDGPGS